MTRLRFIANARRLWYRLWSVRLAALGVIASAIQVGAEYYATGKTPAFAVIMALLTLGIGVSRVVKQDSLEDDYREAP